MSTPHRSQDQSMMLRNMAVISQNINKKNEKKRKDKRSKNYSGNRTATSNDTGSHDDRKHEEQTSMYSACILSANCLSNATHMLQELTGQLQTDQAEPSKRTAPPPLPPSSGQQAKNVELSNLMSNLFKLDRTLNVLNQELKRSLKKNGEND